MGPLLQSEFVLSTSQEGPAVVKCHIPRSSQSMGVQHASLQSHRLGHARCEDVSNT